MDPFIRVGHDIKYRLFNKNFGVQSEYVEETSGYKDKANSKDFHAKLLKEVIVIFHFFNDLRQQYLMTNNIEYFYLKIYSKSLDKNLSGNKAEWQRLIKKLIDEFKNIIPESAHFHNYLKYELPSIDKMYENDEIYDAK